MGGNNKFQEILGFEENFVEFHIDPLHGPIGITDEEKKIIESDRFQRLKYIRQLGLVHHFYHSATHTRYEHSLGVLHTTWTMFKRIFSNFGITGHSYSVEPETLEELANSKIIRALRIAGLCHDLGHGPFSHTFEIISGELSPGLPNHEDITYSILSKKEFEIDDDIRNLVLAITNPKEKSLKGEEFEKFQFFLHDIVAGDIGSDRIDYLLRDTYMTGLGHRFGLNHLLNAITTIYDEDQKRLYLSVEASEKDAVFYFLTTRFYHFQLLANYRDNVQRETEFKKGFCDYCSEQHKDREISDVIREFQKDTDDDVRYKMKDYLDTKLEMFAKWTLFDIDIPLARFFAYRFSYKMENRSSYTKAIRNYLSDAGNLFFSFNVQKARIPVIPVTLPSYTRERPPKKDGGKTKIEFLSTLLHEFSPLLFGLAQTYLRNTTITVFGEKKDDHLKTRLENSPKFLFHSDIIEEMLGECADRINQTEEKDTQYDRLDFLILFVAAMREIPRKMVMHKDDKRIILYRFRSLQFLIREVQELVFSNVSHYPYRYDEQSRFYNPELHGQTFQFHKILYNDLFLLELFGILEMDYYSDDKPIDDLPNVIPYRRAYMFIFKLPHLNKIINEYEKFPQYRELLQKIEDALNQLGATSGKS